MCVVDNSTASDADADTDSLVCSAFVRENLHCDAFLVIFVLQLSYFLNMIASAVSFLCGTLTTW